MDKWDLSDRIDSREVSTPRLATHLLQSGPVDGTPVLFVHGNGASSVFFEETLVAIPPGYRGLAPDLRGFGRSEPRPVDATRGLRDLSDDLYDLMGALGYANPRKVHLVGWSLGGGVAMQYAIDHPEEVASLTLSCLSHTSIRYGRHQGHDRHALLAGLRGIGRRPGQSGFRSLPRARSRRRSQRP